MNTFTSTSPTMASTLIATRPSSKDIIGLRLRGGWAGGP